MKKILGLDVGTNSVGYALISKDNDNRQGEIISIGSRIIPMGQDKIKDFGKGITVSNTSERTTYRGTRRLNERKLLRRTRLFNVFKTMGWIDENFNAEDDKVAYQKDDSGVNIFKFGNSYNEMRKIFKDPC